MASLRSTIAGLAGAWALAGAAIALPALPSSTADARPLVTAASLALPICAALAALFVLAGYRVAPAALLLASIATPTYFATELNLLPAALAAVLAIQAVKSRRSAGPLPAASTSARSRAGGRSSWSNVHDAGSRSGRQRRRWATWRKRWPSM